MLLQALSRPAGRFGSRAGATCLRLANNTMPLRAKILSPPSAAKMSTQADPHGALPGDEPEDVLFNSTYGLRSIELNRPKKLNSLNGSMIRKIMPRLLEWEKSDMANVVVLKGAGEKALCAGGDVAVLAEQNSRGPAGQKESTDYFALEYKLDHLIATYQKPYIAFMDGITMGGGVGLSIHAPLRIATENTVFAMPETTIGFFPDVGASFFLPRMAGSVGTYLALTSDRLKGPDVFYTGIATHYLHSSSLPSLESRLAELRFKDYDTMGERLASINASIEEHTTGLPHDRPILVAGELRRAIDRCFRKNTVEEIFAALEAETGETQEWAQRTLETLHKRSPTAMHVTLRQMRIGDKWSITETFEREYQIAARFMAHGDFTEGVKALLIEKRAPSWQPAKLEDIKPEHNVAEPFFIIDKDLASLDLFKRKDYKEYPHSGFGVPREDYVRSIVQAGTMKQRELINRLVGEYRGKQGIKEVMEEMVARKTVRGEDAKAVWRED